MQKFPDKLSHKIEQRISSNSLRKLVSTSGLVDFCSNDYLGFSKSEVLYECVNTQMSCASVKSVGSTGSRLISGNSHLAEELECQLAFFFKSPATLFFNSGYTANTALLSSVPQRGDMIIYDELIHASAREGMRLSFADKMSFTHNDLVDLEEKLKVGYGDKYVVIESIYSMDGDVSKAGAISEICQKYNAYLIVDEAHSVGVIGDQGQGLCVQEGIENDVFARIYTFGKAVGVHGACVAGDQRLMNYLINFARSFIYTTAPPMHSVLSVACAIDLVRDANIERAHLERNIKYFRSKIDEQLEELTSKGIRLIDSQTAIQGVIIAGNDAARNKSLQIQEHGLDVRAILSPTVKMGSERLRICLHSFNTTEEIDRLITEVVN